MSVEAFHAADVGGRMVDRTSTLVDGIREAGWIQNGTGRSWYTVSMLDVERKYFADNLPSLMARYGGRFIVIKDDTVVWAFATIDEALREGARRFGLQPFLMRLVSETPHEISIPALTLGVLYANPPYAIRRAGNESAGTDRPD